MDRDTLDKWLERGILALVLAALSVGVLALGAVRTSEFVLIQGLSVAVAVLWVVRLALKPKPQFLWPPVCWPVLAFVAYAIYRYATADIEYVARLELLRILTYAVLFFAVLNNLHRQDSVSAISFTLIGVGMLAASYAVYQFATGSDRVWGFINPYKHRGAGTYINPNSFAALMEMLLPVGLAYALIGRAKPLTRILLGYASLVIAAGLGVTVSRGGWVATGLMLLVLFGYLLRQRTYRLPAAVLLVILLGAGAYFVPQSMNLTSRLQRVVGEGGIRDDARPYLWQAAVSLWREDIWRGVGPGHYDTRFRQYRSEAIQQRPLYAHNDYLNTLADYGLIGALLLGAALAAVFLSFRQTWNYVGVDGDVNHKGSNRLAFVLGGTLGLAAVLAHCVVDFNLHVPGNALVFVTFMALLSSHVRFATSKLWSGARLPLKLAACLVLLAAAGYLGSQTWRLGAEARHLQAAAKQLPYSLAQAEALERAFAVEPQNGDTALLRGEYARVESFYGRADYVELAQQAIEWFRIAARLNPWDADPVMRLGMCLDWLRLPAEAEPYFDRATELDPNSYFITAHVGWHHVQNGNYAAARPWLERSFRLKWPDNPLARTYLEIVNRRLVENAADPTRR